MASEEPAGMVRSNRSSTGDVVDGYPNVTERNRISAAGMPSAGRGSGTCVSAPAGAIADASRSTAATGAAAPSSAQLRPPNAIMLVPTAAWAKTTTGPIPIPAAPADASAQNTTAL